jgi:hypothetical protein
MEAIPFVPVCTTVEYQAVVLNILYCSVNPEDGFGKQE